MKLYFQTIILMCVTTLAMSSMGLASPVEWRFKEIQTPVFKGRDFFGFDVETGNSLRKKTKDENSELQKANEERRKKIQQEAQLLSVCGIQERLDGAFYLLVGRTWIKSGSKVSSPSKSGAQDWFLGEPKATPNGYLVPLTHEPTLTTVEKRITCPGSLIAPRERDFAPVTEEQP